MGRPGIHSASSYWLCRTVHEFDMSEVQAVIVKDQKNRSTTKGDTKSMEAGRLVKTELNILQNNTPKHRSWTVGSKRRLTRGAKDDF